MKEYMISIFAASATLSLLSRLSYSSRLDGVRKFAFGILLFSVASSPFINGISNLLSGGVDEVLPPSDFSQEEADEIYEEAFCLGVKNAVCERFELKTGEVRVLSVNFSKEEWRAERIRVILSGKAALSDYREIEKYINNMGIGECEAEIEIG